MDDSVENKKIKARALAEDIIKYAKDSIMVNMRFLDVALYRLKSQPMEGIFGTGTDGVTLFYDYAYILRFYKKERELIARSYLHTVFHCIFSHMYQYEKVEAELWDLAADIAVENVIIELQVPAVRVKGDTERREKIQELSSLAGGVTAERLYRYFKKHTPDPEEMSEYRSLFTRDIHGIFWKEKKKVLDGEVDWKKVSERVKTDVKTFSKARTGKNGSLIKNLEDATKETYDYRDFLKRFAVKGETVQVNDDEFDYIFYTYGMRLYKNMPLIEPLEYKDSHKIREFVIAMDTSGSCSLDMIKTFLKKTYQILKSTDSYFQQVNIHVIQADNAVRTDVKITNQEEFNKLLRDIQVDGRGGTDFRPVFEYVEELRQKGEFQNLKGMIYFTDGYGIFPDHMPEYETAFVFLQEDEHRPKIPAWAIKVVLSEEEIMTL